MPTGYTADIKNGISFEKFVLGCARAFGALISMRDDPNDAEIPDEFKPSEHHSKNLIKAFNEKAKLETLTKEQIDLAVFHYNKEQQEYYEKRIKDNNELKQKYMDMLIQVLDWTPPTPDHKELRNFMITQINESIQHDCYEPNVPEEISPEKWFDAQISSVNWSITYHTEQSQKEKETCENRTKWVRELKNSLKDYRTKEDIKEKELNK